MATEQTVVLTEHEASDLMGLSVATLRAWRHQMKGPRYVKFGRAVRYLQADIERFINAHLVEIGDQK